MRNLGTQAALSAATTAMPQLVPGDANPSSSGTRKTLRGQFLEHPRGFPLSCRTLSTRWSRAPDPARRGDLGLSFHSTRPLAVGTVVELDIALRQGPQRFVGTVVLIRELADGFDIGVALDAADVERATLVQRICALESRLRGPAREAELRRRAQEWAALRPRLERIPALQSLLFLARRDDLLHRA